jgi:hypothetical protein
LRKEVIKYLGRRGHLGPFFLTLGYTERMSDFRDFLNGTALPPGQVRFEPKCSVCANLTLASEVAEYAAGRQDGSIAFSIHQIHARYFGPVRGVGSANTIRTHIRMHLGILDI